MSLKMPLKFSPFTSPSSTTLDNIPPSPIKTAHDSLKSNRFSFPSLDKFRFKSYNSNTSTSFSDDSSTGTLSRVPSRFVFSSKKINNSVKKFKCKARKIYRPKKYKNKQLREVSHLPHEIAILFERGMTSLTNDYQLLNRKLGDGAMGSVYLVQRKSDNKLFAAKLHTKEDPSYTQAYYLQRIAGEVLIASKLHNDHIIDTFDFVNYGSRYATIMEYCPTDLFDFINNEDLTSEQLDNYFVQLLLGIYHMHSQGIAHRDLKLENLCVDKQGKLKIIDFGCAFEFKTPFKQETKPASGIYGSDPYIAPEVWSGKSYDPEKADIWSLAIIYVALHSSRFLWDKAVPEDTRFERFPENVDRLFEKFKIPEHARDILKKILDPNPYTRASLHDIMDQDWVHQILLNM